MSNLHNVSNIDIICAETGRAISHIENMEEKIVNEALAVLEEQGPYAMILYLKARHGKVFNKIEKEVKALLQEVFQNKVNNQSKALEMVSVLAEDLDDLLFTREILRNTLAYARYHLKAKKSREESL